MRTTNTPGRQPSGPDKPGLSNFIREHRTAAALALLILATVLAAGAAQLFARLQDSKVEYITASYSGDTKEGVALDSANPGFTVTAHYHDGREETVTGWEIAAPVTLEEAKESSVTITYKKASTQVKIQCTTGLIQSITAEYDGDTKAGTALTDNNAGIHVFGIRSNGKREELTDGWRVVNPTILEADAVSRVQIEYKEFSCTLSVQCTTRLITKLTAAYTGSTEEGTVISTGSEGLTVTASYKNGETEDVTGWTLASEVRLEPRKHYVLEIHYQDQMCTAEVTCTTPTPEEYMQGCKEISYAAMARNPAHYVGSNVQISGTIEALRPASEGSTNVMLKVDGDFLGLTTRTICANYSSSLHGELPPAGSFVTVYGIFQGLSDVETAEGTDRIPVIAAEYVVCK